jgi:hypothetical protein
MKPKMIARIAGSQQRNGPRKGISDRAVPTIPRIKAATANPFVDGSRSNCTYTCVGGGAYGRGGWST